MLQSKTFWLKKKLILHFIDKPYKKHKTLCKVILKISKRTVGRWMKTILLKYEYEDRKINLEIALHFFNTKSNIHKVSEAAWKSQILINTTYPNNTQAFNKLILWLALGYTACQDYILSHLFSFVNGIMETILGRIFHSATI